MRKKFFSERVADRVCREESGERVGSDGAARVCSLFEFLLIARQNFQLQLLFWKCGKEIIQVK